MKLRITNQQLRLRLDDQEVKELHQDIPLYLSTHFGGGNHSFNCKLISSESIDTINVEFVEGSIVITVPASQIDTWATSDDEGIYAEINNGMEGGLEVAIEKDYPCKH